ncbi:3-hydroxyacyl-[acyl-carrier-protein] dehydratase FabA [Nocardia terpenica]|nr:3-hydroxyacyl-[acyl-carrier-protein] dehydratase FabA [Nocardia terpenica]
MVYQRDLVATAVGNRALVAAQAAVQQRLLERLDRLAPPAAANSDGSAARVVVDDGVRSQDSPLYRFLSRVIEVRGEPDRFDPGASITAEYDVPEHAWYTLDGVVPAGVVVETTQCVLTLLEHLGLNRDGGAYRLLSADPVFHGRLPREGQTIRFRAETTGFDTHGGSLLVRFAFRCHVGDTLIMEMADARAGFGAPAELLTGRESLAARHGRHRRDPRAPTKFKPLERSDRVDLTGEDIDQLTRGELAAVFGRYWDQRADGCNPSIRLSGSGIRMLDEITTIDRQGGSRGFGELSANRVVDPNGWYFHGAPGSSVMPATLLAEGAAQLLQVFAMYSGMHLVFPDGEFQPAFDIPTGVHVLGQVTPDVGTVSYRADITDATLIPRPTVVADVTVYADGRPVLRMTDAAVQVREKPGTPIGPDANGVMPFLGRRNHDGEATHSNEFHLALAGIGEFAAALGDELSAAAGFGNRVPRTPGGDYQRFDRIQHFDGNPGEFTEDSRLVTEYDSAPEWWYYLDNGAPTMPNFVYQEIALQSSLLLGYLLGGPLLFPEDDLYVRNLDGYATLTRPVELRGKTVRQETVLRSHLPGSGVLLQRFGFRLFADGELFYEGQTLYGYFPGEWLKHQRGLDAGKYRPSWLEEHPNPAGMHTLPIRSDDRWFRPQPNTGLRLASGRLHLVDEVTVVPGGGAFGKGYVHGTRAISPDDWYFNVHNDLDKVMPGTLGIESLVQALQVYVMDTGLAADMGRVVFEAPVGVQTRWTYRGQIEPHDKQMTFELSISEIRREPGRLLVIAHANVWKPGMRIYEVNDIAVEVRPADAHEEVVWQ